MTITRDDWSTLMPSIEKAYANSPRVGRTVKVVKGRKHLGETGKVTWHGRDKFSRDYASNDIQATLRDAIGRIGYRVKIVTASGESFFVNADYVEVLDATL